MRQTALQNKKGLLMKTNYDENILPHVHRDLETPTGKNKTSNPRSPTTSKGDPVLVDVKL